MKINEAISVPVVPEDLDGIVEGYPVFCKKWGVSLGIKKLGAGSCGVAWETSQGKVMKLTGDIKEAEASDIVMKHQPTKTIVPFYFVGKFAYERQYSDKKMKGYPEYWDKFVIMQKKLSPLSKDEWASVWGVYDAFSSTGNASALFQRSHSIDEWIQLLKYEYEVNGGGYPDPSPYEVEEAQKNYHEMFQWVFDCLKELQSFGIIYRDIHPGNIMKDNGAYKLIDLGYSQSDGKVNNVIKECLNRWEVKV